MKREEIKEEIEKVREQLEALEKQLELQQLKKTSDLGYICNRIAIDNAAENYREALINAGLDDISNAFGEVTAVGDLSYQSIFLTNEFAKRTWRWEVRVSEYADSEVLVRVDKATHEPID